MVSNFEDDKNVIVGLGVTIYYNIKPKSSLTVSDAA
jgi:hypothetical protein